MKRPVKRYLYPALGLLALAAVVNPSYSAVEVGGPNGVVRTEKFGFGPGRLFVCTRVVADGETVTIEMD